MRFFGLILLILTLSLSVGASQLNLTWGSSPEKLGPSQEIYHSDSLSQYVRDNETQSVKGVRVETIIYSFVENKLAAITFKTLEPNKVRGVLESLLGAPQEIQKLSGKASWQLEDKRIILTPDIFYNNKATIEFIYTPLWN